LQSEWIVVGYWGGTRTFDKLLVHFRAAVASYITTSPLEARTQIQALLPSVEFVQASQGLQPTEVSWAMPKILIVAFGTGIA